MHTVTEIIQTLKAATEGLHLAIGPKPSFEVFYHVNPVTDQLTLPELLTWTGHNLDTPVQTQDFSGSFYKLFLTTPPAADTPAERNPQVANLQAVLERELTNIQLYHIGDAPGETYIIGQDQEGNFAGLKMVF